MYRILYGYWILCIVFYLYDCGLFIKFYTLYAMYNIPYIVSYELYPMNCIMVIVFYALYYPGLYNVLYALVIDLFLGATAAQVVTT